MAPTGNNRWPHTPLLAGSTNGPERQYRWPPQAQILKKPGGRSSSSIPIGFRDVPGASQLPTATQQQLGLRGRNYAVRAEPPPGS